MTRFALTFVILLFYPGWLFALPEEEVVIKESNGTTTSPIFSNRSPILINQQAWLGVFRLDVLTEKFMRLPKSPCKGQGELKEDVTLINEC